MVGALIYLEFCLDFHRELIHLHKQGLGHSIAVLTEVNEDLTEEFFVVAAYDVVGKFGHRAFELQDEEFGEFVSFVCIQACDERIESLAVVEIVTSGVYMRFVREEGRVHFFSHHNA